MMFALPEVRVRKELRERAELERVTNDDEVSILPDAGATSVVVRQRARQHHLLLPVRACHRVCDWKGNVP